MDDSSSSLSFLRKTFSAPATYLDYSSPSTFTQSFDGLMNMQTGSYLYYYMYSYGYSSIPRSPQSHFSAVALPDDVPQTSFMAQLSNTFFVYTNNANYPNPGRVGGWNTSPYAPYKMGRHDNTNGGFSTSTGEWTAPFTGIYYCTFHGVTYYAYYPTNTHTEFRLNGVQSTGGATYNVRGAPSSNNLYYNPLWHSNFLQAKKGDKISLWFGNTG